MPDTQVRAWWTEVQHLRPVDERTDEARRRAELVDRSERAHQRARQREPGAGPPPRRGGHPGHGSPRSGPVATGAAAGERRTIVIRGRVGPPPPDPRAGRSRPPRAARDRVGARPDRLALWALLMGLVLILVAVGTADAAAAL